MNRELANCTTIYIDIDMCHLNVLDAIAIGTALKTVFDPFVHQSVTASN